MLVARERPDPIGEAAGSHFDESVDDLPFNVRVGSKGGEARREFVCVNEAERHDPGLTASAELTMDSDFKDPLAECCVLFPRSMATESLTDLLPSRPRRVFKVVPFGHSEVGIDR